MVKFDVMHLSSVDLNLLVVLNALLETQSIKAAATRLSLSPSATSHALGRLRDQFDDQLLIRAGKKMVPTTRALRLQPRLQAVLENIEGLFQPETVRAPAALERTFVIGANDFFELVILPKLSEWVRQRAPKVNLFVRPLRDTGIADLRSGELDATFGVYSGHDLPDDIRLRALMFSRFVCLLRSDHPALQQKWTTKRYAALDHILVSPRGQGHGIVDLRLAELGLRRRVSHRVGNFSSAPALVASSDCVLTISEYIADVYEARYNLVRRQPPLDVTGFVVSFAWHARADQDPELQWLFEGCSASVETLTGGSPAP